MSSNIALILLMIFVCLEGNAEKLDTKKLSRVIKTLRVNNVIDLIREQTNLVPTKASTEHFINPSDESLDNWARFNAEVYTLFLMCSYNEHKESAIICNWIITYNSLSAWEYCGGLMQQNFSQTENSFFGWLLLKKKFSADIHKSFENSKQLVLKLSNYSVDEKVKLQFLEEALVEAFQKKELIDPWQDICDLVENKLNKEVIGPREAQNAVNTTTSSTNQSKATNNDVTVDKKRDVSLEPLANNDGKKQASKNEKKRR
jgi:hypothetical protein